LFEEDVVLWSSVKVRNKVRRVFRGQAGRCLLYSFYDLRHLHSRAFKDVDRVVERKKLRRKHFEDVKEMCPTPFTNSSIT